MAVAQDQTGRATFDYERQGYKDVERLTSTVFGTGFHALTQTRPKDALRVLRFYGLQYEDLPLGKRQASLEGASAEWLRGQLQQMPDESSIVAVRVRVYTLAGSFSWRWLLAYVGLAPPHTIEKEIAFSV